MDDLTLALLSAAALLLLVGLAESARRLMGVPPHITRTTVHIGAGVLAALAPLLFATPAWPTGIALAALLSMALARIHGHLPALHAARSGSWGTVWSPAAALLLYQLAWAHPPLVTIPLLVMAFGDAAGVIASRSMRRPHPLPAGLGDGTWAGSVAVFGVSGLAVALGWEAFGLGTTGEALLVGIAVAPVAAGAEALFRRGLDNLALPFTVAFTLHLLQGGIQPAGFLAAEGLAMVVAVLAVRLTLLRADGGVAAFLLASVLLGGGGWRWALPVLLFFILSSLLSRAFTARRRPALQRAAKGGERDALQVAANGGIPLLLFAGWSLAGETGVWWVAFLSAVAAANGDTWATEVGTMLRSTARSITTARPVPAGTSGGVTLPGSAAGVLGAFIIAMVGVLVVSGTPLLAVTLAGAGGMLADSLLGATLQGHWQVVDGAGTTEQPPVPGEREGRLARGLPWMTNDVVNVCGSFVGALLGILLTI